MRHLDKKESVRRGSGPGHRRTAAGTRRADPWHTRRARVRRWPAVVLTAIVCSLILLLVFSVANRHTARISASYGVLPLKDAASEAPEKSDANKSSLYTRLEWKEGDFVLVQYGTGTSTELDTSRFIDPSTKNSHDLVEWATMAWENQWGYVCGTFGHILTEDLLSGKLEQYPDELGEYEAVIREKWMGRRVADCVGLIKSYGWYDPATGDIKYGSGDMPDTGTDGMWDAAVVKGDIDTMQDEPGLLVYSTEGQIGVYIGDGFAIEAISHAGGVVKTKVAARPWTGWLQCPYILYDH